MSLGVMGAFHWIGRLFLGEAKDAASTIIQDEIHKVHDEIAGTLAPILAGVPQEKQQEILLLVTEYTKKAAVAYAEAAVDAYVKSKIPAAAIPALTPPPVPTAPSATPTV